MKQFSIICEDAFHKRFNDVTFQDDAAIHIWREAWTAAMQEVEIRILELQNENN